ncbi:flagellar hook-associated protein FlgL [Sphaerotilus uruguayifluvii]|uniref:Flagellar hook-associated protein 3 FlgL n=1 Tax=Sphaerotilus uruguayifluvii TaxID=2735897 RepID=A0ABX2G6V6_9BURK|nr:flagellar hook-associated protein FlgL [Leptothrix sp. C29]NRT58080.1 flagellar hook-associated protein 3 FlgL [Leptothrix sp. C29]
MSYRIASAQSRDFSLIALQRHEKSLSEAQQRLISGKRVDKASDDPAAAARAERALVDQTRHEGLLRSMEASRTSMSLAESTLGDAMEVLQSARETVVSAGNGAYNASDRASLADSLKHARGQLLKLANTTDTGDHYIFGGQGAERVPFADAAGGVTFQGVAEEAQASLDEVLPLSVDGESTWLGARSGNGVFETSASTVAGSTAWISAGSVGDPSALALGTGESYQMQFTSADTYTISLVKADGSSQPFPDASSATRAYTSGQAITVLPGMNFSITGTPKAGDTFSVEPSTADLSVFDALDRMISVLSDASANSGALQQTVNSGLRDLDQVMSNLQSVRSRAGNTLNRLDGFEARTDSRVLADKEIRSNAEDLDLAQAISDVSTKDTVYQAALKSYAMIGKMSLFDYIGV